MMHIMVEVVFLLLGMLTPIKRCLRVLLGAVYSRFLFSIVRPSDLCLECLGFKSHLELRNFSEFFSPHISFRIYYLLLREYLFDCAMQLICVFV